MWSDSVGTVFRKPYGSGASPKSWRRPDGGLTADPIPTCPSATWGYTSLVVGSQRGEADG